MRYQFLFGLLLIGLTSTSLAQGEATPQPAPEAAAEEAEKIPGTGSDSFIQVQLHTILFTLVDFHQYESVRAVQEQMRSIPGVTDFIPHMATQGLLTYDLRYSGHPKLLLKALRDTMGQKYELGLKEMGSKQWEITVRKL